MTDWPAALDRAGRGRLVPQEGHFRTVQRYVLRTIGALGMAPSVDGIAAATGVADVARPSAPARGGLSPPGTSGGIVYPFSLIPTAH